MTGFGSASEEIAGRRVSAELRAVNARHLKLSFRLPEGAEAWEPELRERISSRLSRGHVELRLEVRGAAGGGPPVWEVDEARAAAFVDAVEGLGRRLGLEGGVDLPLLVRWGGVLRERAAALVEGLEPERVAGVLERALEELVEMREREGARLAEDLRGRLTALRQGTAEVTGLAPDRLARERERLRAAVAELVEGSALDEDRLAREIALLADKWDIGEEIVRTRSHLDAFEEYLEAPAAEPVGKRLAFLVQELQREINTMGAKANDPGITRRVVEMKNEVERLREQVENVE